MKTSLSYLSSKLLDLHRDLILYQTRLVEAEDGKKYGPYELLGMAINDPRYTWLRKLSELITQMDISTSRKNTEPIPLEVYINETTKLFDGSHPDFSASYNSALLADPHLEAKQAEVKKALNAVAAFLPN